MTYELTIQELTNAIRIIKQKLPTIDESIKTYETLAKNCIKEKDEMLLKAAEYEHAIKVLKGEICE